MSAFRVTSTLSPVTPDKAKICKPFECFDKPGKAMVQDRVSSRDLACIAGVPIRGEQKAAAGEGEEGRERLPARGGGGGRGQLPIFMLIGWRAADDHVLCSWAMNYSPAFLKASSPGNRFPTCLFWPQFLPVSR